MTGQKVLGGTDGFRGQFTEVAGPGHINEETFSALSAALAEYSQDSGLDGPVVVARDTRPSGERLLQAVVDGLHATHVDVVDLDVAPTPVAQKIAQSLGAMATIVVTASHNPSTDNGWKGMIGNRKPDSDEVKAISNRYWDLVNGGFKPVIDIEEPAFNEHLLYRYVETAVEDIEAHFGEQPLANTLLVIDGAYGAGSLVSPELFRRLGAEVTEFACGNGVINEGVGAADLSGLKNFLVQHPEITTDPRFIGAIAHDGDADRVMAIGAHPVEGLVEITGNHFMWAMAQDEPGIVGTVYTNSGVIEALTPRGIDFEYCANGDRYVTQALLAKQAAGQDWTRGGEFTGHLIDTHWLSSGDGPHAGAWFASWVAQNGLRFHDVHDAVPLWHEQMEKVVLRDAELGELMLESTVLQDEIRKLETGSYGADIRIVARPSGTEPVFRLWAESEDKQALTQGMKQVTAVADELARRMWQ